MSNEIMAVENNDNAKFFCTYNLEDKRNKLVVAKALNAAVSLKSVNEPFVITGIITTPGERSQSGTKCINTYLVCEDGTAYFSQSDGIANSVERLHWLFNDEEIAEGITVFVKTISLDGGRSLKTLDFIIE